MNDDLWWAYGVVALPARLPAGLRGVDEHPVELIEHDALGAAASRVGAEAFSGARLEERLNDLDALAALAAGHEAVLERVLDDRDVVPFRLCTLYASRDAVRSMLESARPRLVRALARVHAAVELGVKAFAAPPSATEPPRPASGAEYLAARLAQRERQATSEEVLERAVAELHAELSDRSSAAVLLRPQDRRLSGRDREMIFNGAYLVRRTETAGFARLVERFGRGLELEVTGPWPPYHFAEART